MTWADRFRPREGIRHSLWLVPLFGPLVGMLLAWGADRAGSELDMPSELTFTPSTASSVLSAILGAMIGLVGFVVTVTVLLVQTSTSQFSARYMRLVYRDRLLIAVLAVPVGTFAYSFVLLRRVGETESPDLGLVIVGALVLLGVPLLLLFFSRLLQRLRPVAVAASVTKLGIDAFLGLTQPTVTTSTARELPVADVHPVLGTRTGTIQRAPSRAWCAGRTITPARPCSGTASGTSSTRTRRCSTSTERPRLRMPLAASKAWSRSGRSARSRRIPPSPSA